MENVKNAFYILFSAVLMSGAWGEFAYAQPVSYYCVSQENFNNIYSPILMQSGGYCCKGYDNAVHYGPPMVNCTYPSQAQPTLPTPPCS